MTGTRTSHPCPGPHRAEPPEVDRDKLACLSHWRQVPRDLQAAVYAAWRGGDLGAHAEAIDAAISHMGPL